MSHFIFHFDSTTIFILVMIATSAALIDTLAGGGGLIAVSALIMMGMPPVLALGTCKFQSCIGMSNATFHFIRNKKIDFKILLPALFFVALGSILGTCMIQIINNASAEKIIPWLLMLVVIYTYCSPYFLNEESNQKISIAVFSIIFGFFLGFYNGFLGPGTGALWVFLFMFFMGFNLISASIYSKPLNMMGSFVSLIVFVIAHHVLYLVGMIMAVGQLIGSRIGVHFILEKGMKFLRPVYLFMITTMTLLLFWKIY